MYEFGLIIETGTKIDRDRELGKERK